MTCRAAAIPHVWDRSCKEGVLRTSFRPADADIQGEFSPTQGCECKPTKMNHLLSVVNGVHDVENATLTTDFLTMVRIRFGSLINGGSLGEALLSSVVSLSSSSFCKPHPGAVGLQLTVSVSEPVR